MTAWKVKYSATITGGVTTGIWALIYVLFLQVPGMLFFPAITLLPAIPLQLISSAIFGSDTPMELIGVLLVELVLLIILCVRYFRKVIRDARNGKVFDNRNLIVFFIFLQFIVHPLVFYSWMLINDSSLVEDPFFALVGFLIECQPYVAIGFIPLGLLVDFIKNSLCRK